MRETMCTAEAKEFNAIEQEYEDLTEQLNKGLITREELKTGCVKLLKQLDELENKYNEIYEQQEQQEQKQAKLL